VLIFNERKEIITGTYTDIYTGIYTNIYKIFYHRKGATKQ